MKQLLVTIACAALLSGCCEMAYGPSQCRMHATNYLPEQPLATPPVPASAVNVPVPAPSAAAPALPVMQAAPQMLPAPQLQPSAQAQPAPVQATAIPAPAIARAPQPQPETIAIRAPFMMGPSINGTSEPQVKLDKPTVKSDNPNQSEPLPESVSPEDANWLHP